MSRRWQHVNGHFQDTKAAEELKPYLQGFCKVCCAGIADSVASEVKGFDGGVVLQEIERKDMVRGGANWGQHAPKVCASMWVAIFRIQRRWIN